MNQMQNVDDTPERADRPGVANDAQPEIKPTKPYKLHPVLHAADLLEESLRERLAPLGVKPRQARILNVLNLMGSASQADLAREFNISAASVSTMTARLISSGFVSRRVDSEEPRRNELSLTGKGKALIEGINNAWMEVDTMMDQLIGAEDAHRLAELASRLRTAMGGHVAGADTGYEFYRGVSENRVHVDPEPDAQTSDKSD